jgi:hypothetical protein
MPNVLLIFLDGVGLGPDDPVTNPFATTELPTLAQLLDGRRLVSGNGPVSTAMATLVPTDARLGVPGLPQSATGQATIFSGLNAPRHIGQHYGPYPNPALRELVHRHGLFGRLAQAGYRVAFANAYPHRYLDRLARGTGRCSVTSVAAQAGGVRLRGYEDLCAGRAVSPFLTNEGWRDVLGYTDVPIISAWEAGRRVARLLNEHDFVVFEHYATDIAGHRADHDQARQVLEQLDAFLGGVVEVADRQRSLIIVTSDHGNLEDLSSRKHTLNPVPTLLIGCDHRAVGARIRDLTHIAPAVVKCLEANRQPGTSAVGS